MRWTSLLILILASTLAKGDETNEISPSKLPVKLDATLRKALLKALTELEEEENAKEQQSLRPLPVINTDDKTVEKASASALSFFASTDSSSSTEKLITTEEPTAKPIVIIQNSRGLQHKPITTVEKSITDVNDQEQILTSATSSFTSNKFSFSKTEDKSPNRVSDEVKATNKFFRLPKVETTTTTTTTSTEESEAKVEDVQFFSAPLVAAFTVHQDESGLPKSVEPIFRSAVQKNLQKVKATTTQKPFRDEHLQTQLALQEKQRALEAEILRLKQQQQQQNYLIRQQQIQHQQQLQLQKQKILDEQARIRQTQAPFLPTVSPNFNVQTTTPRNEFTRESLVSFQPSISFTSQQYPTGILPVNGQQLPVKTSTEFRSPFALTSNIHDFNYLSHQQPPLQSSFSSFHFIPTAPPPLTLTAPKAHRVFSRQESNTGNFFNSGGNSFNQFNQVPSHQQSNRFFRSNVETFKSSPYVFNHAQPPAVNQQLNNLLYSSGLIRGNKQQEDLNIVSKVLALNHYGGDYRFDSSNVNEQRILAPVIKKV